MFLYLWLKFEAIWINIDIYVDYFLLNYIIKHHREAMFQKKIKKF